MRRWSRHAFTTSVGMLHFCSPESFGSNCFVRFQISYFSDFKSCVMETFEKGGEVLMRKRCPKEEDRQSVIDLIGGYGDDAMEMVCGEFGANTDGSKCEELLKVPTAKDAKGKGEEASKDIARASAKVDGKKSGKSKPLKTGKSAKSILPYFVNIFGKL